MTQKQLILEALKGGGLMSARDIKTKIETIEPGKFDNIEKINSAYAAINARSMSLVKDGELVFVKNKEDGVFKFSLNSDENIRKIEEQEEKIINEEVTRKEKEKVAERKWTDFEIYRSETFNNFRDYLNKTITMVSFDLDHAKTMKEYGSEAHTPDNFQIITKRTNVKKSSKSTTRMTAMEQKELIVGLLEMEIKFYSPDICTKTFNHKLENFLSLY
jgi:hypothetical protein